MKLGKRKHFFINPRFQFIFILFTVSLCLLNTFLFYLNNYLFFHRFQSLGQSFGISPQDPFFQFISEQQIIMSGMFIVTSFVDLVLILSLGTLFSHRVSGPLYRLKIHLQSLSVGEVKPTQEVRFRKGDFFPELAESLNSYLKKVESDKAK